MSTATALREPTSLSYPATTESKGWSMTEFMWNTQIYESADRAESLTATNAIPLPHTDQRLLRNTLGNFATGVTVVTYESKGVYHGVTVNSFTSVSMDPPLVLVSLMRSSRALPYLLERPFAVNVLAEEQLPTALRFAGKAPDHQIEWVTGEDAPRINDAIAFFQCQPWAGHDGGDHVLVLGQVTSFGQRDDTQPLLFYRGQWGQLASEDQAS